jgi:hypothetical protein
MGPIETVCVGLLLIAATPPARAPQGTPGPTVEIVIPTPEPRRFVLVLDEIELDWTRAPREGQVDRPAPASVPGTRILNHERQRTRVRIEGARTVEALAKALEATLAANPGAGGEIVVYEAGGPRTVVHRQLLTSDVAVMLHEGVPLENVLARASIARADVAEAPGGYVIRSESPFAALEVARQLGTIEGVKHAYPLLKRTRVAR